MVLFIQFQQFIMLLEWAVTNFNLETLLWEPVQNNVTVYMQYIICLQGSIETNM